jgi:hypothetical protein
MKALLVVETDRIAQIAKFYLRPLGFEVLWYRNPLKAMDNIDEVDPDVVICSAEDFPRHWKPLVQFIRQGRDRESCVVVLLRGERFSFEEAAKALQIGVNGVVSEELEEPAERLNLQRILRRYIPIDESRSNDRICPSPHDRLEFAFSLPGDLRLVSGKIESISSSGLLFKPDDPLAAENLKRGDELAECSIRVGDSLLSVAARVIRSGRVLALEFSRMRSEDRLALADYLDSWSQRSLRARFRA